MELQKVWCSNVLGVQMLGIQILTEQQPFDILSLHKRAQ
jgi:hypothetical protein